MAKSVSYRKEFFDREYTAKEAYSRLWQYARRYRFRIWVGIICGMLTAGTLIPFFQVIKPALSSVEAPAAKTIREESPKPAAEVVDEVAGASKDDAVAKRAKSTAKEYNKIRDFMAKFGIKLQSEDEELGLPLLFLAIVVVPLVALFRCGLVFLNHYCLAWAGMNTVRDIRNDIFRHVQAQSMQFHGRIDVGQLMSRCTSDPQQVRMIIQTVLQELAQAPFEIAVSVGFIIYSAISNRMLPTLGIIVFGFPLFMLPVLFLSKRIRKWSKKALERLSVVGSRIHEILTCIKVVKAYNTEEYECRKYNEAVSQTLKATMRSLRWGLLVGPAVETVGILLICAFLVWCYFAGVKLSTIIPMLAPLLIIYRPLKQLSKLQVQIEQGRAALARIWSAMDVEMELPENPAAQDKSSFEDSRAD